MRYLFPFVLLALLVGGLCMALYIALFKPEGYEHTHYKY